MIHGVGEFIERAARAQPMVLTYEDLHWADESTLVLLRHLGGRIGEIPLLVIGTYRDDELDSSRPLTTAIGPLFRDVGAVDLRPRLLSVDEVRAVLTARAGSDAPPELVDLVYSETQGNPFFTEELFRHLRDNGRLFDDEGRWRSGFEIGDTEVPQGVRLILDRRLDLLGADHRRALASAAVIGRTFTFDTLAAVSSADEDDLFDALEAAERNNLIEELPAGPPRRLPVRPGADPPDARRRAVAGAASAGAPAHRRCDRRLRLGRSSWRTTSCRPARRRRPIAPSTRWPPQRSRRWTPWRSGTRCGTSTMRSPS